MDFWRGEAYQKFFEYLDQTGGFYYEVCFYSIREALFFRGLTGLNLALGRCTSA